MEKFEGSPLQDREGKEEEAGAERAMDDFYEKLFGPEQPELKVIRLDDLRELKEKGITTERFLDYLCNRHGVLLHGSMNQITGRELMGGRISGQKRIFAANQAAVAIMRSLYSNVNVNLWYPHFVKPDHPFRLIIHTPPSKEFRRTDRGYVYVVSSSGFVNNPEGSWQFETTSGSVPITASIETEFTDFTYPVEVIPDLEPDDDEPWEDQGEARG